MFGQRFFELGKGGSLVQGKHTMKKKSAKQRSIEKKSSESKYVEKQYTEKQLRWYKLIGKYKSQKELFFMIIPCMIFTFIFCYMPLRGWIMAFQNFKPGKGYRGSKFVGLQQFEFLFKDKTFWQSLRNTLVMSTMNLVIGTVVALIFALLLNEIRQVGRKRIVQTISYLPHFLSWIIVCSLAADILSTTNSGVVNNLLLKLGIIDSPILFLGTKKYFWWIYVLINIWKEMGWNTIIYIAAMAGIDQSLYEAAEIDGANRYQKMWHITLPGIRPTIIVILIMNLGWILNTSFEIPYLLGQGLVLDVSETLDLFVLRYGIKNGNFSLGTAGGLFKSFISIILVSATTWFANHKSDEQIM